MIRQFEVFANPDARTHREAHYLLVLQSDMLPTVLTVVVAPMRPRALAEGIADIQVPVLLDGEPYAVLVLELAHVPTRLLRRSMGRLLDFEFDIRRGLDRVFTGF